MHSDEQNKKKREDCVDVNVVLMINNKSHVFFYCAVFRFFHVMIYRVFRSEQLKGYDWLLSTDVFLCPRIINFVGTLDRKWNLKKSNRFNMFLFCRKTYITNIYSSD